MITSIQTYHALLSLCSDAVNRQDHARATKLRFMIIEAERLSLSSWLTYFRCGLSTTNHLITLKENGNENMPTDIH